MHHLSHWRFEDRLPLHLYTHILDIPWSRLHFLVIYRLSASVSIVKQLNDYMSLESNEPPRSYAYVRLLRCLFGAWILFPVKASFEISFRRCLWKCLKLQITSRLWTSLFSRILPVNNVPLRNLFGNGEKALVCFIVKFQLLCEWL